MSANVISMHCVILLQRRWQKFELKGTSES